jgi:hypothetical protein
MDRNQLGYRRIPRLSLTNKSISKTAHRPGTATPKNCSAIAVLIALITQSLIHLLPLGIHESVHGNVHCTYSACVETTANANQRSLLL